jgi:hypothetical protein
MTYQTERDGLSRRIRQLRIESYGAGGLAALAADLGIPGSTWRNYEAGVVMPSEVLLRFIDLTRANPTWLLRGVGERFLPGEGEAAVGPSGSGRRRAP